MPGAADACGSDLFAARTLDAAVRRVIVESERVLRHPTRPVGSPDAAAGLIQAFALGALWYAACPNTKKLKELS